jgi:hypothetical protein
MQSNWRIPIHLTKRTPLYIHLDANCIFIKAIKNRPEGEMIRAYQKMVNRMQSAGLSLKEHQLDNKVSATFKQCIMDNNMTYKLSPPGNHRRNQAEQVIQTFKSHFISILSGVDDKFPLSLWCYLFKPMEFTLNMLCQTKVAPNISAYAHVHCLYDHMLRPLCVDCAIQAHVKPEDRRSWHMRSDAGFNLGTLMEHHIDASKSISQ